MREANYADHVEKLNRMHSMCRSCQVWYTIEFSDGSNQFAISIHSSAKSEEFQTRDYGDLDMALETAIEHLQTIMPN